MRTLSDVFARSRVHLLLGAAIAATIPCTALAQSASIEEIIVTAQKREERLQDVPIAISAVTVEQIEARGIDNVLDLRTLAPNLMVSKYPNSNVVSQIAIRGGVTVNAAMYWEPSTAMYLDGVYLGKAVGSVFEVVDIERIEVLRGPRGRRLWPPRGESDLRYAEDGHRADVLRGTLGEPRWSRGSDQGQPRHRARQP